MTNLRGEHMLNSISQSGLLEKEVLPSDRGGCLHLFSVCFPCKASSGRRTRRFGGDGCSCTFKASTTWQLKSIRRMASRGFIKSQRTTYAENLEHVRPVFHCLPDSYQTVKIPLSRARRANRTDGRLSGRVQVRSHLLEGCDQLCARLFQSRYRLIFFLLIPQSLSCRGLR